MRAACTRFVLIAAVLCALAQGRGHLARAGSPDPAAGTQILNAASATWQDNRGNSYQESSNVLAVAVAAISALTVSPKEFALNPSTDGYPAGQNVTRTFVITNASNIPDAYRITAFTADKGQLVSMAFVTPSGLVPVTPGSTVSPSVQPGQSIAVQIVVSTAGIAIGSSFAVHVTAQTTAQGSANGTQSDSGEQWLLAAAGASISGPSAPSAPISKTVNHQQSVQSQSGSSVTYDITAKNYGGTPAADATFTDTLPAGVTVDAASVKINGSPAASVAVSGQTLTVRVGTLAAGATVDVSFAAAIASALPLGSSYVNVAQVSADGVSAQNTTAAGVLIGTADLVFDPANGNAAVAGATISLLDAAGAVVALPHNPCVSGAAGTYGFALSASHIPAGGTTLYLVVSAPGYVSRRIRLMLTPTANAGLYDVATSAIDGEPLARAGGYTLTNSVVSLQNVLGLFGNIPLFKAQTLGIDKSVSQATAQAGDRLTYAIDVANASNGTLAGAVIIDTLPAGEAYATRSARLDGAAAEPATSGRTLTWKLESLQPGVKHTLTYAAVVFPSVAAGTLLANSATAQAIVSGTTVNVNASANADVEVVGGALSDRYVITGRVFIDVRKSGDFTRGDRGLAGVRVYMEDGTTVLTDARGRFTIPAARPGMHVLRVDETTLPSGVRGTTQRLVHGVLDEGVMQDVQFGMSGTP